MQKEPSIGSQFYDLFSSDEKSFEFSTKYGGHEYKFSRESKDRTSYPPPDNKKGYISFEKMVKDHSIWGGNTVEFHMYIDDVHRLGLSYNPEIMALPKLMQYTPKFSITEYGVYFELEVIESFKELEGELIDVVVSHFNNEFKLVGVLQ